MQQGWKPTFTITTVIVGMLLMPLDVYAHGVAQAGFMTGLLHPLSGLDHLFAALGMGLWAGQLAQPARWIIPAAAVIGLLTGLMLATTGLHLPLLETVIATSLLALGGITLLRLQAHGLLAALVTGGFSLFHGHVHALEADAGATLFSYGTGLALATLGLILTGIVITGHTREDSWKIARLGGGVIAATGLWMLSGMLFV